jgi:hypothetical protein
MNGDRFPGTAVGTCGVQRSESRHRGPTVAIPREEQEDHGKFTRHSGWSRVLTC